MSRKSGILFRAVPDTGKVDARLSAGGGLEIGFPNCFIPTPRIEKLLQETTDTLWYSHGAAPQPRTDARSFVVNFCADHDEYRGAMEMLAGLARSRGLPVFNAPEAVLNSRRDRVSELAQGIAGLTAPRCVRFRAAAPEDFARVFAAEGFDFPVLVRPARSQTGHHLVKIDGPDDWQKIHAIPWGGADLYMTQFVDFRSAEGGYVKIRAVIAGDRMVIRHTLFADDWAIHAMDRTPEIVDREFELHKALYANETFTDVVSELRRRVGLDFFGIDMGMIDPGHFVLFEANAAMSILSTQHMPTHRRPEYMRILKSIEEGLLVGLRRVEARAGATAAPDPSASRLTLSGRG